MVGRVLQTGFPRKFVGTFKQQERWDMRWWWWWWDESVYLFVDARKLMNVLVQDEIQRFASFGNCESWVEIYPWIDMKRWWMSPFSTEISFINYYRFWPSQCNECRRHCSLHPPFSNLINYLLSFVILWTFSVESAKASWNLPFIEINHVLNLFWN